MAAIHLPGHGLCKGHLWQTFTFDDLLEQGLAAEAWLKAAGFSNVAACGHSQGAILALAHGAAPHGLTAVSAISGVLPQMDEAAGITLFRPFDRWRAQIIAGMNWLAEKIPALPIPLPAYLSLPRILRGRRKPWIVGREYGRFSYPLRYLYSLFAAQIPALMSCPVLLLGSANDSLFPPQLLQKVYERIQAPRKELILAPDGGHTAPFNKQMAEFFARSTAAFCASLNFPLDIPSRVIHGICRTLGLPGQSGRQI